MKFCPQVFFKLRLILWCKKSTLAHYLMQSLISVVAIKLNLALLVAYFMVHKLAHLMIQVTVLCVDEKTNLQPRPRKAKTLPAKPELSVRVEHEYERKGALNLFAAFDTRTGKVWGQTYERKRQEEFIAFLEYLDNEIPPSMTTIHLVLDNLSVHKGKKVQARERETPTFYISSSPRSLFVDEPS